jgi:hypothetical protein
MRPNTPRDGRFHRRTLGFETPFVFEGMTEEVLLELE